MKLVLSRQFDGFIWRLMAGANQRLALEVRAEDRLEVRFLTVDLATGDQAAFESPHITWWTNLEELREGGMMLKQFDDGQDPSRYQHFLLSERGQWDLVQEGRKVSPDHMSFPAYFQEGTDAFQTVSGYLTSLGISPVLGVEYTEWSDFIVVGYYTANERLLDRHLLVLSKEGSKVLQEKIDTGMRGVAFESFFTFTDCLIFVKERKELNVYRA